LRLPTKWKKIFVSSISDKGLIPEFIEFKKLNSPKNPCLSEEVGK
jgi:hypothetical protein